MFSQVVILSSPKISGKPQAPEYRSWSSVVRWTWQFWVLRPSPCKGQWFHDVSQLNSSPKGELVASRFFFDCHRFRQVLPPENGSRPEEPLLHIAQIFHMVVEKKFKEHDMNKRVRVLVVGPRPLEGRGVFCTLACGVGGVGRGC